MSRPIRDRLKSAGSTEAMAALYIGDQLGRVADALEAQNAQTADAAEAVIDEDATPAPTLEEVVTAIRASVLGSAVQAGGRRIVEETCQRATDAVLRAWEGQRSGGSDERA